jgi:hypothetical protein
MFTIRHLRPQGTLYSKVPARQFRSTRFRLSEEVST